MSSDPKTGTNKPRKGGHLVSPTNAKRYALERVKLLRPTWQVTQVSKEFLDDLEIVLRRHIDQKIHAHPSRGQTLTRQ